MTLTNFISYACIKACLCNFTRIHEHWSSIPYTICDQAIFLNAICPTTGEAIAPLRLFTAHVLSANTLQDPLTTLMSIYCLESTSKSSYCSKPWRESGTASQLAINHDNFMQSSELPSTDVSDDVTHPTCMNHALFDRQRVHSLCQKLLHIATFEPIPVSTFASPMHLKVAEDDITLK